VVSAVLAVRVKSTGDPRSVVFRAYVSTERSDPLRERPVSNPTDIRIRVVGFEIVPSGARF